MNVDLCELTGSSSIRSSDHTDAPLDTQQGCDRLQFGRGHHPVARHRVFTIKKRLSISCFGSPAHMLYFNVTSQQRRMTRVHIRVTCATFYYKAAVVRQSKRWYLFLCCPPMSGWTCNSHELCQKTTPRSATVIVLVWQLCFLCISETRPRLRFTLKHFSNWREKKKHSFQSYVKVPCVCLAVL